MKHHLRAPARTSRFNTTIPPQRLSHGSLARFLRSKGRPLICLSVLSACDFVALNLRSLRIHHPRLCHFAVFSHRSRAGRPRALALPYGSGSLPASPRTISIESAQASCYTKIVTQDRTARDNCPPHTGPRIHSSTLLLSLIHI